MQGLVQAVGISNYGPKQMQRIHAYLQKRGVPLAAAQVGPCLAALSDKCPALLSSQAMAPTWL